MSVSRQFKSVGTESGQSPVAITGGTLGTGGANVVRWSRIGNVVVASASLHQTSAGTATGTYQFKLPYKGAEINQTGTATLAVGTVKYNGVVVLPTGSDLAVINVQGATASDTIEPMLTLGTALGFDDNASCSLQFNISYLV